MSNLKLQENILYFADFVNKLLELVTKKLEDLRKKYNISAEQAHVIGLLGTNKKLTLTEITRIQGVDKAAVSRRIKKLIDAELVEWVTPEDEQDLRIKYITLTEKGKAFKSECDQSLLDIFTEILDDIPMDDLEQAMSIIEIVSNRVQNKLY
ncbi:MarR family transcriptional regulator [Mammaliicoccus sciuri]|uniref:MarR family winged helix-turn-helix transcriptional regulator n=1 Tax=Mammaliicoccus sciuri TaxID=1296 RepID=UPI00265C7D15|nr:MarR family transcriptional regulator [Mammaliicoccus sciuri]MDO0952608.1 MarR family transcriptional regulator [Mammaliicoccus sciuri]